MSRESMRRAFISWALGLGALWGGSGCNAVLGNESGELASGDGSIAALDASTGHSDAGEGGKDTSFGFDATIEAGGSDAGAGDQGTPDAAPGITCTLGQKICEGNCVSVTDPLFGCSATSCTPCALDRGSAICAGGACAVGTCNAGYADCNQKNVDGCETDLSMASHCGTCNAVCGAGAPNCAPTGSGFACTTGCTAEAPTLCGSQCVDLLTSANHCGSCNGGCAPVANGTTSCNKGTCAFACGAGFHACGATCASNTAVASCGASCTACTPPANGRPTCDGVTCGFVCDVGFHACGASCLADDSTGSCGASCAPCVSGANATATCTAGACGLHCAAGFADCNKVASDGCEINIASDPLNCGSCGHSCGGQACNANVCAVPPVDSGPPDTGPADTGPPPSDAAHD